MLKDVPLNSAIELESIKNDIQTYFGNFGEVKSVAIFKENENDTLATVLVEFSEIASAIIAKGYAQGEKYGENVIDLEFVNRK